MQSWTRTLVTSVSFLIGAGLVVAVNSIDMARAQSKISGDTVHATDTQSPVPLPASKSEELAGTQALTKNVHKPRVFFVTPKQGETVASPVHVEFGVDGYKVKPAGTMEPLTGHHHVIVDGQPVAEGEVIPADATHIHFGKGQTKAEIPLEKGTHTLTLQFADGSHKSYGPNMSQTIHITVK